MKEKTIRKIEVIKIRKEFRTIMMSCSDRKQDERMSAQHCKVMREILPE